MKTLAKGWFDDVYNNNSIYGDKMIENLHHWIYNDKSRLYDPILGTFLLKKRKNAKYINEKNILIFTWKIEKFRS